MNGENNKKSHHSFYLSLLLHGIVLSVLICSFDFGNSVPILQHSNKNTKIINAMVVNASEKNIPKPVKPVKPVITPSPILTQKNITKPKPDVIAISDKKQKKLAQKKLTEQLLADINKNLNKKSDPPKSPKSPKSIANAFAKDMKYMKQMLQDQKQIAGAKAEATKGEVNKFKALILQTISQNWLIPGVVDKSLFAELLIRVAPGGVVLDVQLTKSSGDPGLDRSARAAVFKSSPLPVPKDSDAFEEFRQFVLKVKPENILSPDSWV